LAKDGKEVDRLRRNAADLKNVGINSGSDLLQKKAMYLTKRADSLEQTLRPAHVEKSGEIRLANRGTHAKVMLAIADLKVATPDGTVLFQVKKLDLFQQDRVVLLGRNGVGKSVFVRLLLKAMTVADSVAGIRKSAAQVMAQAVQGRAMPLGNETGITEAERAKLGAWIAAQ
jgi:ATPase subunit of ABC transporter with duplicated ATPase domains